ncbi:MAG: YceI family protein [Myxococcales bacterium]
MAETWNIDTAHSQITFTVRHMVFAKVRGRFGKWTGALQLDPRQLGTSQVEVKIDAASIDTSEAQRDAHLKSPDFLDVARFPELTFKSRRVELQGKDKARITGDLSLHGVTREVALEAEVSGRGKDPWGNERIGFSATTAVDRTDFGLKWNQALEAGGLLVGTKIDIEIELQTLQQKPA